MIWGFFLIILFSSAILWNIVSCFASEYIYRLLNIEVDKNFVEKYKDL